MGALTDMAYSRYEDVSLLSLGSEAIKACTASANVCASAKKRPWILLLHCYCDQVAPSEAPLTSSLSMLDMRRKCEPYFDSLTKSEMLFKVSLTVV